MCKKFREEDGGVDVYIPDLVGVAFTDRLGSEEKGALKNS